MSLVLCFTCINALFISSSAFFSSNVQESACLLVIAFFFFFLLSYMSNTPFSTMTSFLSAVTTPTYPLWHEWLTSLAGFPTMLRHVHSFEEYLFSFSLCLFLSCLSLSHISQMFLILSSCSTIHLCFLSSIHPPFSSHVLIDLFLSLWYTCDGRDTRSSFMLLFSLFSCSAWRIRIVTSFMTGKKYNLWRQLDRRCDFLDVSFKTAVFSIYP